MVDITVHLSSNWQNCEEILRDWNCFNIERYVHHYFARSAENIAIVSETVAEDQNEWIPRRYQELRLPYGILWRF